MIKKVKLDAEQQEIRLQALLDELRQLAELLGRTPLKGECPFSIELKQYLGPWPHVCAAAGLQKTNTPEQRALRDQEIVVSSEGKSE